MREAVIVAGVRTAVGKASKGKLRNYRPDELGARVLFEAANRVPGLKLIDIDDIVMGCSLPEAEQGFNMARVSALRAGFPAAVPAFTVNRFCSSGLQSIAIAAEKIMCGFAEITIGCGVESMSHLPMNEIKLMPNPYLVENYPEVYMPMGQTAEEVAARYGISREEQDKYAYLSNAKALSAIRANKFKDEIIPLKIEEKWFDSEKRLVTEEIVFDTDEGPRADNTMESLSKLKPVFKAKGTVTAGNSSQTSDGAAAIVLMSHEKAIEMSLKPFGILRSYAVAGVEPDIMGIGPVYAIPKALKIAGLRIEDIDLFEINEAFASQAIYCIRALDINPDKVNVNGGAIALGHPLGCTGSKLTVQLLYEMRRQKARYGIVSMCIGGGMGAAAVYECIT